MQSYTQILYQVVFATRLRQPTLPAAVRPKLFAYMAGIMKNKRCRAHSIGGIEDHVHLVFYLHPSVALADLVRDIKVASNLFLKSLPDEAPDFVGWQNGYSAFTYQQDCKPRLVNYVERQVEHHKLRTAKKELRMLLAVHQVEYDERYFG